MAHAVNKLLSMKYHFKDTRHDNPPGHMIATPGQSVLSLYSHLAVLDPFLVGHDSLNQEEVNWPSRITVM